MRWIKNLVSVLLVALFLLSSGFLSGGEAAAGKTDKQDLDWLPLLEKRNPRLDSWLNRLVEAKGWEKAAVLAGPGSTGTLDEQVRVVVECRTGRVEEVSRGIDPPAVVETQYGDLLQVLLPVSAIPSLAEIPGVVFIRRPDEPVRTVISEGAGLIRADDWKEAGYTGSGVKIGIIDTGFSGYQARQSAGELPAEVTTWWSPGLGGPGSSVHGTACAEIIHDIVPDAELYLANIGSEVELGNAVDWLISRGVQVISHSLGWPVGGPGDGTGLVCEIVDKARDAGILWVTSAGNSTLRHWQGSFTDTDIDGIHEFVAGDEGNTIYVNAGQTITAALKWDDPWDYSANDYALFLIDNTGSPVVYSNNVQNGNGRPAEILNYTAAYTGAYSLAIVTSGNPAPVSFQLYSFYHNLEHWTASNSIIVPADSASALAVGAVPWDNPSALEYFSSQGPTRDGRIKPDLVGPDGVSTATYGTTAFYGTSASTPHVAGAAALVKQRYPDYTPSQVQAYLEARAVDLGDTGKDNLYGSGRLDLGLPQDTSLTVMTGNALHISTTGVTLNGNLIDKGSFDSAAVYFEYGTTTDYGYTVRGVPSVMTDTGLFNVSITGLTPNTLYHYRAKAIGEDSEAYGEDRTFNTLCSLTVNTIGQGTVSRSPAKTGYLLGESVQLTAVPAAGWKFDVWNGDLTGSSNPAVISLNNNKTVTARFIPQDLGWVTSNTPNSLNRQLVSQGDISLLGAASDGKTLLAYDNQNRQLSRSTDGGLSWTVTGIGGGLPDAAMVALAVSNNFSIDKVVILASDTAVYASSNGGTSFGTALSDIADMFGSGATITSAAAGFHYSGAGTAIMVGVRGPDPGAPAGGVAVMEPGGFGGSWKKISFPAAVDVYAVAFSPDYLSDALSLFVTADASGAYIESRIGTNLVNWGYGKVDIEKASLKSANIVKAALTFPADYNDFRNTFFVGLNSTAAGSDVYRISLSYKADDGSVTSTSSDLNARGLLPAQVNSLSFKGNLADGWLYVGLQDSPDLWRATSANAGTVTFSRSIKSPAGTGNTNVIASRGLSDDRIWASASGEGGALSLSTDGGINFNQIALINISEADNLIIKDLAVIDADNMYLILRDDRDSSGTATRGDISILFKTVNGGVSWQGVYSYTADNSGRGMSRVYPSPGYAVDNTLYVVFNDFLILRSNDAGSTFTPRLAPLSASITAFAPVDAETYYVGTVNGIYKTGQFAPSDIGGETPNSITYLNNANMFVGTANGSVYHSTDGGKSFSLIGSSSALGTGNAVLVLADVSFAVNNYIYAGSDGAGTPGSAGVFRWKIGESSQWQLLINAPSISDMHMGENGALYASSSTPGVSIYRCLNPAEALSRQTWETMNNPQLLGFEPAYAVPGFDLISEDGVNQVYAVVSGVPADDGCPYRIKIFRDILTGAPGMLLPADGAATPSSVRLSWSAIDSPIPLTYRYQVAVDSGFSSLIADDTTTGTDISLTGLHSNTVYYWRVFVEKARPLAGGRPAAFSFTTVPDLQVLTLDALGISPNSARLYGNLAALEPASTVDISFQWGTAPGVYPDETPVQAKTAAGTFHFEINGLSPNTTYYFRAKAAGSGTVYGEEKTFKTQCSLTVNIAGQGNVVRSPDQPGYNSGTDVTLTAAPSAGWTFTGWSGDLTGNVSPAVITMSGNKSVTATFTSSAPPSSGGGGGFTGGGGGGGGGTVSDRNYLTEYMGAPGVFLREASVRAYDGLAVLLIPAGTVFQTAEGWSGSYVTLEPEKENPPPSPDKGHPVGLSYKLGPGGSTFSPAILLRIIYSEGGIPAGMNERDLVIGYWDGQQWQALESEVDPAANTVTARISHFSQYGILAQPPEPVAGPVPEQPTPTPSPASFMVSSIIVSPAEVEAGEGVRIQAVVANTGGIEGKYEVVLTVNGVEEGRQWVEAGSGKTERVEFEVKRDEAGEYRVEVNGKTGRFRIIAPPETGTEVSPAPDPGISPVTASPDIPGITGAAETPSPLPKAKPISPLGSWVIGIAVIAIIITGIIFVRLKTRK